MVRLAVRGPDFMVSARSFQSNEMNSGTVNQLAVTASRKASGSGR